MLHKKKKKLKEFIPSPKLHSALKQKSIEASKRDAEYERKAFLKKEPMGPPRPKKRLLKRTYEDKPVMQTEAIMSKSLASVKPSKPRYGAGGTDNPRKPRYGAGGTDNPKVKKKKPKTAKQKLYEEQIKARKKRQKKDPLGRD